MKIKFILLFALLYALGFAQVGINNTSPKATLQIDGKNPGTTIDGIIVPRLTGDQMFDMPIPNGTENEATLVYATSAASATNQANSSEKVKAVKNPGFYYWDGTKWSAMVSATTISNTLLAYVKPMNILLNDGDTYTTSPNNPLDAPTGPAIRLFDADYNGLGDFKIINNPLNVTMWDNTEKLIRVPQQLLGYCITINLSLKFQKLTSNAESSRLVAYTGNAVVNATNGTYTGGSKIKDLMFTGTKTATGTVDPNYVRDELVLSPIIVTQQIIDFGIKLYVGSAMNGSISFYEPILTVDYGVVNTTL